ncbi:cytochrome c oxidase subunit II [Bradyrhizobium sp. AUGA SZCCT0222]|uniref:cytochrome c oxidase subunit II n=1 Tax=Bradyrhizobium sp. AUGA SZCCT0222 TaxID=2807668 RepID=UPI001BAD72B8|nr:cytochrome c oxidase subunit II [Bradyrhizobium sp. AUGA SZCCT0222]MBR1272766.1 cytochrome c oxidase subunit II [Bradyrhizobium sp. AUGA SZCCT0222]
MNGFFQSVLAPHGPQAEQIAMLAWVLFAFGSVILGLVIAATWLSVRGAPRIRGALAQERSIIVLGLALPVVTLTVLLGYGVWLTRVQAGHTDGAVRIEVTGEQWWWRVVYAGPTPVVSSNEIRIPVGQPVDFTLKAADVIHSFWVPSLGGKVDMIPGRTTRLRLTAERAGVYRGQCAEYCGGPHALMALNIIAMPRGEYDAWLARAVEPKAARLTDIEQRGRSLFLAAGCGTCHVVRGTDAAGTIGPDLTDFGARGSVGIDTLPLTAENVAGFIREGQHIKPGNLMPEFRIFSPAEQTALVNYLMALR